MCEGVWVCEEGCKEKSKPITELKKGHSVSVYTGMKDKATVTFQHNVTLAP